MWPQLAVVKITSKDCHSGVGEIRCQRNQKLGLAVRPSTVSNDETIARGIRWNVKIASHWKFSMTICKR